MKENKIEIKKINTGNIREGLNVLMPRYVLEEIYYEFYGIFKCIGKWNYIQKELLIVIPSKKIQNLNKIKRDKLLKKIDNLEKVQECLKNNILKRRIPLGIEGELVTLKPFCNSLETEYFKKLKEINVHIEDIRKSMEKVIDIKDYLNGEEIAEDYSLMVNEINKHIEKINEIVEHLINRFK